LRSDWLAAWTSSAVREGRVVVVEHKTAARKFTEDQLRYDFEPDGVQRSPLGSRGWAKSRSGSRWSRRAKCRQFQIADIHRMKQDEQDFLRTAGGV